MQENEGNNLEDEEEEEMNAWRPVSGNLWHTFSMLDDALLTDYRKIHRAMRRLCHEKVNYCSIINVNNGGSTVELEDDINQTFDDLSFTQEALPQLATNLDDPPASPVVNSGQNSPLMDFSGSPINNQVPGSPHQQPNFLGNDQPFDENQMIEELPVVNHPFQPNQFWDIYCYFLSRMTLIKHYLYSKWYHRIYENRLLGYRDIGRVIMELQTLEDYMGSAENLAGRQYDDPDHAPMLDLYNATFIMETLPLVSGIWEFLLNRRNIDLPTLYATYPPRIMFNEDTMEFAEDVIHDPMSPPGSPPHD